jgi:hypothetical protein
MVRDDSYRGRQDYSETARMPERDREDERIRRFGREEEQRRYSGRDDYEERRRRSEAASHGGGDDYSTSGGSRMYNEPYSMSEGQHRGEGERQSWREPQGRPTEREFQGQGQYGPRETGWRFGQGAPMQGGYGRESYGSGAGQSYGRERLPGAGLAYGWGQPYGSFVHPTDTSYGGYGSPGWGTSYGRGAGQWETGPGEYAQRFSGGPWGQTREGEYGRGWGTEEYGRGMGGESFGQGWKSTTYGRFRGRGPRSYRRSDERIREDVNDRLTEHPEIDAVDIEVAVLDCEVTLKGTVDDRDQKRLAEDVAEFTPGVKDVHNKIKVDKDRDRAWKQSRPESAGSIGTGRGTTGSMDPMSAGSVGVGDLRERLRERMEVMDADGDRIGEIKEIRNGDFLIDRPMRRDIYVPQHAIREVSGDRVILAQRKDEIDDLNWESPELVGGGKQKRKT